MTKQYRQRRVVVGMLDGFGIDYFEASDMRNLKRMARDGLMKQVRGVFPSITNVNNVSICCAAWPNEHGITGNSYFDEVKGRAEYMNAAELIRVDTLFKRAATAGVKSALLTSKRKTVELFHKDTEIAVAAEDPPPEYVNRYGKPGDIYSSEINYWLWEVAGDILVRRPDIGCLYVHTTDYPMHMWAPGEKESKKHLSEMDDRIEAARQAAGEAMFLFTADHGMNFKTRCWDLMKACEEQGTPIRFALSPERDYYVVHHRNFTGSAYLWLRDPGDAEKVSQIVGSLEGVEEVLPAAEAARRFRLAPEHIGDLVVFGDKDTMFGELDSDFEVLPETYRAHGSLYEMDLPLIIYDPHGELPPHDAFQWNKDLTRFLYK